MNYKRILISEAEKRRIRYMHENSRKKEFKNLIKEDAMSDAESFFNEISRTLTNFPAGTIIDYDGKGTMVWQVTNQDNTVKYYLFQDGTARNQQGKSSTNRWYTDLAPTSPGQTDQEGTSSQETSVDPSKDPGLVSKDEMNTRKKQEKENQKQAKKKQRQDSKDARQNCRTYNGYFEKGKATLSDTEKQKYVAFLDSCCDIFLKMNQNKLTKKITIAAESTTDGSLLRPYCQATEYDTLEKV